MHATGGEDSTLRRTHIFHSLVVSSTRTPEHFLITHVRVAQVCKSPVAFVMFGVVCTIAHQTHLFILDVMSHPNLLGLDPESFTSFFSASPQPPHTTRSTEPERASLTELRCHLSATSPERQFGHPGDSIPLTELVRRSVHPCEQQKWKPRHVVRTFDAPPKWGKEEREL